MEYLPIKHRIGAGLGFLLAEVARTDERASFQLYIRHRYPGRVCMLGLRGWDLLGIELTGTTMVQTHPIHEVERMCKI